MRAGSQLTTANDNPSIAVREVQRDSQYSKFVDRVNAQRFKAMVGRRSDESAVLGLPFAIERPHAARAHRELEEELKPAARREGRSHFSMSSAYFPEFSVGGMFVALAGFCGLICAYALQRSFK